MSLTVFSVAVLFTSLGAGVVGAILGLGGGILLVPILTIFYGVDLHYAMGASIISVIATSSGAAASYLRTGLSNLRVGLFLVVATITGALTGAFLAGVVPTRWLELILGLALSYSAFTTIRQLGGRAAAGPLGGRARDPLRPRRHLPRPAPRPRDPLPRAQRGGRLRGHVRGGRALRHARHRQRRIQGARDGLPDAPAHEGLHR
ncbi:MAG TPA: sulfite exporter TauE/SafE family protein, partial [Methylomirabilota bacterium]